MKIFAAFVLLLSSLGVFFNAPITAYAADEDQEPVYALIKEDTVLLNTQLSPVTTLPPSYFVIIRSDAGTHYTVSYLDLTGFVDKSAVEVVDYEPKTKFHSAFFTCSNDTHPANIRATPHQDGAILSALPDGQTAFLYGTKAGSALIEPAGDTWYYVKYSDIYGYVYCTHGIADAIEQNTIEKVEKQDQKQPSSAPQGKTEWLYVLMVCIPAAVIMLTAFSRPKRQRDG